MDARLAAALAEIAQFAPSPHGVLAAPVPIAPAAPHVLARSVVSPHEQSTVVKTVAPAADDASDTEEDAAVAVRPTVEDSPAAEFDEAAESAFLAEAKERGEPVAPKPAAEVEDANPKALPPLDELVKKIPPDVREALEDLFRARFVSVKRFPKKALKG